LSRPAAVELLTAPRSGFITALAWILIVVGGFTMIIAVLHNVMIFLVFRGEHRLRCVHARRAGHQPSQSHCADPALCMKRA